MPPKVSQYFQEHYRSSFLESIGLLCHCSFIVFDGELNQFSAVLIEGECSGFAEAILIFRVFGHFL